ncbi:putative T-complex 11 protein [Helianthus annuus]|nr:putative T-complex 11 protein [Helianthus annuus]
MFETTVVLKQCLKPLLCIFVMIIELVFCPLISIFQKCWLSCVFYLLQLIHWSELCKRISCVCCIYYHINILAKDQLRLAKLDQLRQAARTGVEVRVEKECAELGTKVELHARQAERNKMRILRAYRNTLRERTSQSLTRRISCESKYKECVGAAISQKRAAPEKKRLELLEADMERAHASLLQVRKVAKFVSQKREIERRRTRESLEDKLLRAKRQRAEYLMHRAKLLNSVGALWTKKTQKQADYLSRKLGRYMW